MVLSDWIDVLGDLPKEAVERACRERLRSTSRHRPLPGEIRAAAERHIAGPMTTPLLPGPREPVVLDAERQKRADAVFAAFKRNGVSAALSALNVVKKL